MDETRRGVLLGLAAWVMWGFFPLYFPLLEPAGAAEILGHRIVWSLVVVIAVVLLAGKRSSLLRTLAEPRTRWLLTLAAVLITVNWGTYIWAVNQDHVVEASLGYFTNPLVSVLMGVVVLGERLRRLQWAALLVAGTGVVALTVEYGRPPWIALVLAFSFGAYGLVKKKADAGAIESLAVETLVLAPFALVFLVLLGATGHASFGSHGPGHAVLIAGTGVITVLPLLCFGAAATRVPLSTLGLMQYLTPTVQFVLGLTVFGESMPPMRWAGFGLIWVALALFTFSSLSNRHRERAVARAAVPV